MNAHKDGPQTEIEAYVTGIPRIGLMRTPPQNTDFTTILWIHHQTIHVYMPSFVANSSPVCFS